MEILKIFLFNSLRGASASPAAPSAASPRAAGWQQQSYARDIDGVDCFPTSSKARSFCLVGAIENCYAYSEQPDILQRIAQAIQYKTYRGGDRYDMEDNITNWNDEQGRKFEDVRAVIDKLDI